MEGTDIHGRIEAMVQQSRVVLFMKGNKMFPQCGFSSSLVQILGGLGVDFETHNVLDDPDIRSGIKEYSDWPTIPQLYIDQEFVGGSDIVSTLFSTGELHQLLGVKYEPPKPPEITLTDAMAAAFSAQRPEAGDKLRIQVGPEFSYEIGIDDARPGDFEVTSSGVTVLIDPDSAKHIDGLTLDFKEGPEGGVVIQNPNEPPPVGQLTVAELKAMMNEGSHYRLLDVRTDEERATALIAEAVKLDPSAVSDLASLEEGTAIVLHCHHGGRSQKAAEQLRVRGFSNVHNLVGGIDAWSLEIDPSVPRY